jgi:hypothetical protein
MTALALALALALAFTMPTSEQLTALIAAIGSVVGSAIMVYRQIKALIEAQGKEIVAVKALVNGNATALAAKVAAEKQTALTKADADAVAAARIATLEEQRRGACDALEATLKNNREANARADAHAAEVADLKGQLAVAKVSPAVLPESGAAAVGPRAWARAGAPTTVGSDKP